jgi:tetratricopeptide (TPR) repeat protein
MLHRLRALSLGLLALFTASMASGQTPASPAGQAAAPGLRKLTGDDEKRAKQLEVQIHEAVMADHWDEAIARNEELVALRERAQGAKHFETVNAEWVLKLLRRAAPLPKEDQAAITSADGMNAQGEKLRAEGKYAAAQPLFEKALEINRRLLTDDHPHTARSYANLALDLSYLGRHAAARPLHEKALEIRRRLLTDDHPDTASSYDNVAANLNHQGKYAAAQTLFEKALEIRRRLLTDDNPATAITYNNLAHNLDSQGKYAAAQPLFEKALEINRRLLTDDHPQTAGTYHNLAHTLAAQGEHAAAQPMYEKALQIYRRLFSDDHPATANCYASLARNLDAQAKYTAAQPLYEKALEISRRLLTDNHPNTALMYRSVGSNLNAQGKYAAAQPLFEKALEINRRLLTDNHHQTAVCYNELAHSFWIQGKYAEAQPLFEKALEINRRLLTDEHPDTASCYQNLASNLQRQGKYAQAGPLYEKALEISRRLLTDDNPTTALYYRNLASNLQSQGKCAQAQPLYEKALEISRRLLTDDHPDTATSYNDLATDLVAQGKFDHAQPLLEKALEIQRHLLTDDHPFTATSYHNLAGNLAAMGRYAQAQPLFQKVLEIRRRLLLDDHRETANTYTGLAQSLSFQGKHAAAQPMYEKALELYRRLLTEDHPATAMSYHALAMNLKDQGKYVEARDRWQSAAKSQDASRLRVAFTGMERAAAGQSIRPALAAVLARLGQPAEAWQQLEEDFGRGLLDELAARQDRRLAPGERARLRELTTELERLDKLAETTPKGLDQAARAKRFEELERQHKLSSIALGEFQTKLVEKYGPLAGQVAGLKQIQAALPADAALLAWVDIPAGAPAAADPDGEHWGVVVRSRGIPAWIAIAGTGPSGHWTKDDNELAGRLRAELQIRPGAGSADRRPLVEKLRKQRLEPLAKALGGSAEGLPPARRLVVLPSRAMAGIPIEAILAPGDTQTISYAPSATIFQYLRDQPRPGRHAGLLALGDPIYEPADRSTASKPLPDHGMLINMVAPGSNAAIHGLKAGDVLLAYNGTALHKREDLKAVPEPGGPVPVEVWREGQVAKLELAPGKLGVVLDTRPAPLAIAEQRKLKQMLVAARSGGDEDLAPLPGTRYEVEALGDLFKSDDRPTTAYFGADASESKLDRLATSGELGKFGFIHLATHGLIDEAIPQRSAVILTQAGLPDPLEQVMNDKPVFDGRLSVREIQRSWDLKAELVTLSACETALGPDSGGEGFVGFTQALLMSGSRSVCLSFWKVDDAATSLLMQRFYANLLGRRSGLSQPLPKAEALAEAKGWLRKLTRDEVVKLAASLSGGEARGKGARKREAAAPGLIVSAGPGNDHPYAHPYYWAAFVLVGDPE